MPIPSFEENLAEARKLFETRRKNTKKRVLAPALAGFFSELIGAGTPSETYTSRFDPATGGVVPLERPVSTGGTLAERLGRKAGGGTFLDQPTGDLLTRKESAGFQTSLALSKAKQRNLFASGMALPKVLSDLIYQKLGKDSTDQPLLTVGEGNLAARFLGKDVDSWWKELQAEMRLLGMEIDLNTIRGIVPSSKRGGFKEGIEGIRGKLFGDKKSDKGTARIRVKHKTTGQTGTIEEREFDSSIYEKL